MKTTLALALLCAVASAQDAIRMEVKASSEIRGLPKGWSTLGQAPRTQGLQLTFAIKQTNLPALEEKLLSVSDPASAEYGKHLTNDEVHALIAPRREHVIAVTDYLTAHGIEYESMSPNDDFIQADVTMAQAEELLSTKYHTLHHAESGYKVPRVMSYSLPAHIAAAVDFVTPTVHIPPAPKVLHNRRGNLRVPKLGNTPKHLRELYSVDAEGQFPDNKMAVTAFLNQHYHKKDLNEFWRMYCEGITCGKGLPKLVGDDTTGLSAGIESMLDIETITGIAGNVSSEFWGFSGKSPDNRANEPFMKWLTQMTSTSDADIPKVFSTSYGEDESSWSLPAATRLNVEFQKAGARGISLLYASGDEGANCEGSRFTPETPGSSPWVTAVGGTTGSSHESAASLSSGGFSDYWPMPDYQKAAVQQYLTHSDLPKKSNGYNVSGRAYPDISAQATDFTVVANGFPNPGVAGTSCATPTASGVIALVNDARLQAGKSTLGFLNPLIYSAAGNWNDIVKGSSGSGCEFGDGWPAVKGWDAVTGVGTPNYKSLVQAALDLS